MNRQVRIATLALVTVVIVIVAVQPLLPVVEERFSELGILGPNQTIGDYPRIVLVNQSFLLYGLVGNHEGVVQDYQVMVKLGNETTIVSNTTYANAPLLAVYARILTDGGTWLFPMNLTITNAGTNWRLIFELWSYNPSASSFAYTGVWNQVWMNVTLT
jgi:uncharacterized membrane protein